MTALWIGLGVIVAVLLVWRLRRATKVLDRLLREERVFSDAAKAVKAAEAAQAQRQEFRNR